jgi:hypothetical protein
MTTCKNCENSFEGKYCPNCSQKADTHRFTIKHFAHEFFHAFTHTDKGIFFLIKELFLRPGKVAREFNAGKRKKYFNPITYLLIVMALQIYLSQKTGLTNFYIEQVRQTNQTEISVSADGQNKNYHGLNNHCPTNYSGEWQGFQSPLLTISCILHLASVQARRE